MKQMILLQIKVVLCSGKLCISSFGSICVEKYWTVIPTKIFLSGPVFWKTIMILFQIQVALCSGKLLDLKFWINLCWKYWKMDSLKIFLKTTQDFANIGNLKETYDTIPNTSGPVFWDLKFWINLCGKIQKSRHN